MALNYANQFKFTGTGYLDKKMQPVSTLDELKASIKEKLEHENEHKAKYEMEDAAIKAVETVDTCVGKVVEKILSKNGNVLITADHGNAELMQDPETKTTVTAHSTNPVPFIVVGEEFKTSKLRDGGRLSDIAPTVLDMMNLKKPEEMTGESLIIK